MIVMVMMMMMMMVMMMMMMMMMTIIIIIVVVIITVRGISAPPPWCPSPKPEHTKRKRPGFQISWVLALATTGNTLHLAWPLGSPSLSFVSRVRAPQEELQWRAKSKSQFWLCNLWKSLSCEMMLQWPEQPIKIKSKQDICFIHIHDHVHQSCSLLILLLI